MKLREVVKTLGLEVVNEPILNWKLKVALRP